MNRYLFSYHVKDGMAQDHANAAPIACDIDLDDREDFIAFADNHTFLRLKRAKARISARGILVRGFEEVGSKKIRYHEVWCAYMPVG
jgi:hypothetical protein